MKNDSLLQIDFPEDFVSNFSLDTPFLWSTYDMLYFWLEKTASRR